MSNTVVVTEKFTPAPWASEYDDNGFFYVGADDMPSPYIAATGGEGAADEANAKLIAASPDLFAACKEFVRKVEAGGAKSSKSYEQMKAAIKKATE